MAKHHSTPASALEIAARLVDRLRARVPSTPDVGDPPTKTLVQIRIEWQLGAQNGGGCWFTDVPRNRALLQEGLDAMNDLWPGSAWLDVRQG